MECASSHGALNPTAAKYNITLPDITDEGEKIIYFWPIDDQWEEIRLNTFFLIYKAYINACRLRKVLPEQGSLDRYIKNETRKVAASNPGNKDLVENMLPFWTENEITQRKQLKFSRSMKEMKEKGESLWM